MAERRRASFDETGNGSSAITLRLDQPVEGVEMVPHVYLRARSREEQTATMRFTWFRSTDRAGCCRPDCPAVMPPWEADRDWTARLQCAECDHVVYCSYACMTAAWPAHRLEHGRAGARAGGKAAKAAGSKRHLKPPPARQWVELSQSKVYAVTSEDVGYLLRLEVTAVAEDGSELDHQKASESLIVLAAPPLPPPRSVMGREPTPGAPTLRVMSYNVLAEIYSTRQAYPYCPLWGLSWAYRKHRILHELATENPDIICLQEVQANQFEGFFVPELGRLGYVGVYKQKTREAMGREGQVDGCALFVRAARFAFSETHVLEFNQLSLQMFRQAGDVDVSQNPALQRLLKDNVAQITVLEPLTDLDQQFAPQGIVVANTHIFSHPEFPDVKLWQTHMLLSQLEKVAGAHGLPLVLCGDFNSIPESAAYALLAHNAVPAGHPDLADPAGILPPLHKLTHAYPLTSAYGALSGAEPAFTSFAGHFDGTLDYIWHSQVHIETLAIAEVPTAATLMDYARTALPNPQYPSDHVYLCADLQLRHPIQVQQAQAQQQQQQQQQHPQQHVGHHHPSSLYHGPHHGQQQQQQQQHPQHHPQHQHHPQGHQHHHHGHFVGGHNATGHGGFRRAGSR